MIDANQLLVVAEELATSRGRGAPQQAKLRRAISSAYYALFHHLVESSTDLLVNRKNRGTERYALVYRSFEHRRMADTCKRFSSDGSRSQLTRRCATLFVELQTDRHDADYDPDKKLTLSEAKTAIIKARTAMMMLGLDVERERFLFLTALLFKPRSQ